jgi:hypothetical protein
MQNPVGVVVPSVMNRPAKSVGLQPAGTPHSDRSDRSTRTAVYVIPSITAVLLEKERGACASALVADLSRPGQVTLRETLPDSPFMIT